ncbi:hypothetical protein LSTR_LSTR002363 [Laodelphax striatellus]|uniref:Major facilitator superfamily (MFS) profile domain-containing protein n=1 Tax=Laodelphax striatellus TaxID=195883 RepID=A0A482X3J3_LAOST|nr:hypothetical protein LSTR_LSTR002363 [Laodelphax striatellus]
MTQQQNGDVTAANKQEKQQSAHEDLVQKSMGDFGPWQVWICLFLSIVKIPVAWCQLGIVFLAAPMHFQCATTDNATEYDGSDSTWNEACFTTGHQPCKRWLYDRSVFRETIISEWDLVCDRKQLANVAQMILMIGILVGNLSFSIAADRFGRKAPVIFAGVMQMITGVATAMMPWLSAFFVFRFLQAVAVGGTMTVSFVLCMEFLGGKWRTIISSLTHVPFNIGQMTMVVIAYYTRDWRLYQLAVSLPCVLFIFYIWLIPESPRWLLAVGKHKKALKILEDAARKNKNPLPSLPDLGNGTKKKESKDENDLENKVGIFDLVRTPNMRKRTFVVCFDWAACGLCFYGLTQYVSHVGGNIFLNVAISGSLVVPGMLLSIYCMESLGRRMTLAGGQSLSALACFLLMLYESSNLAWSDVMLGSIGILGCGISFPTLYLFTGEFYPTVIRNIGVGTGSLCARIGSMVAPFVASLNTIHPLLPPLAFAIISLIGAAVGLYLPETYNCDLPQTIEEGENFGIKRKKDVTSGTGNAAFTSDDSVY